MQSELIRFLGTRDNYTKYASFVKDDVLAPEVVAYIKCMGDLYKSNPTLNSIDFDSAKPFMLLRGGRALGIETLNALTESVKSSDMDSIDVGALVSDFVAMHYSNKIVDEVMKADGKPNVSDLKNIVNQMEESLSGLTSKDRHIIDFNLDVLTSTFLRPAGFHWRLPFLNNCVGPIAGGDLVVVGARPETGKTSFITSEVSFFVPQMGLEHNVIIFNNEEKGEKILGRVVQSTLNRTASEIAADVRKAEADYLAIVSRKDRVQVYNRSQMSVYDVERVLKKGSYKVIVFNVLDKVRGFKDAGNETERLRQLYQWARSMASEHDAVVFVVAQADATAENVKYIYQDQLYNSKTAIQGEADLLITIGALHGVDNVRYINLPKNKIPPVAGVDVLRSHGHDEVKFDALRGRYY